MARACRISILTAALLAFLVTLAQGQEEEEERTHYCASCTHYNMTPEHPEMTRMLDRLLPPEGDTCELGAYNSSGEEACDGVLCGALDLTIETKTLDGVPVTVTLMKRQCLDDLYPLQVPLLSCVGLRTLGATVRLPYETWIADLFRGYEVTVKRVSVCSCCSCGHHCNDQRLDEVILRYRREAPEEMEYPLFVPEEPIGGNSNRPISNVLIYCGLVQLALGCYALGY